VRHWTFDQAKFDNLVHYIIWKCPDRNKLGSVKLHKILWKADTGHYVQYGEPISGARYVKRPFGPATDELLSARERLKSKGKIDFWRDHKFAGEYTKDAYEALQPPLASFLTENERKIVDFWINDICFKHTAASISEETHGYAWDIAEMGEELPMEAALVERGREPDDEEFERIKKRAKERGLI
jgi:hypothetical protein